MISRRSERIAHNEAAFRALNESLEASVHRGRPEHDLAGFVCECGDPDCEAIVRMSMPAYEAIRADSQLFFLVPGHEIPDVEDVVEHAGRYAVVRKHTDAAAIAQETDARR